MFLRTLCWLSAIVLTTSPIIAFAEPASEEIDTLSKTFGHLLSNHMKNPIVEFSLEKVIEGMREQQQGKAAPMTQQRFEQILASLEKRLIDELSEKNLLDSENFLQKNKTKEGIVSLDQDKVQYQITAEGKGAILKKEDTPIIRYQAMTLDGTVISDSTQLSQECLTLSLQETAPGIQKGMEGMRVGEKRTIHIHPSMTLNNWEVLAPNTLITFQVELVDIQEQADDSVAESTQAITEENIL